MAGQPYKSVALAILTLVLAAASAEAVNVPPSEVDPFPDGKLVDKGCGVKKADKTFGAPIFVDVVLKQ